MECEREAKTYIWMLIVWSWITWLSDMYFSLFVFMRGNMSSLSKIFLKGHSLYLFILINVFRCILLLLLWIWWLTFGGFKKSAQSHFFKLWFKISTWLPLTTANLIIYTYLDTEDSSDWVFAHAIHNLHYIDFTALVFHSAASLQNLFKVTANQNKPKLKWTFCLVSFTWFEFLEWSCTVKM